MRCINPNLSQNKRMGKIDYITLQFSPSQTFIIRIQNGICQPYWISSITHMNETNNVQKFVELIIINIKLRSSIIPIVRFMF